jgi:hypothetical protein
MANMSDQTVIKLTNFIKRKNYTHTKGLFGFFHSVCPVIYRSPIITPRPMGTFKIMGKGLFIPLSDDSQKAFFLAECLNDSFGKALRSNSP